MKSRSAQTTDDRPLRNLLVEVDELRIVGARKRDDLFFRHLLAPEWDPLADDDVLEMQEAVARVCLVLHGRYGLGMKALFGREGAMTDSIII
jgi:hypothetical protein